MGLRKRKIHNMEGPPLKSAGWVTAENSLSVGLPAVVYLLVPFTMFTMYGGLLVMWVWGHRGLTQPPPRPFYQYSS